MPDLTIYDSQGNAIADGVTTSSERVKNFFFDGVRLAVDTTGRGVEVACFFRARESAASRSEQYYAVFESSRIRDIRKFGDAVEERVETDLGMSLDTSTDDTTVFEILQTGESTSLPLSQQDIDDIIEVLGTGHQPRIGAGTYRDAVAIFREILQQTSRNTKLAIAENADSSHLSEYDLVIEKGSYVGAEIFGETEDAIEEMKEQQRQLLQEDLYGPDDSFSSSSSSSGNDALFMIGALVVVLGVGLVVLTVFFCGTVSVPVLSDALCGGTTFEDIMYEPSGDGTQLRIAGTLQNGSGGLNDTGKMTVNLSRRSGDNGNAGDPVVSYTDTVKVSNGSFAILVPGRNLSDVGNAEKYDLTLSYNGTSGTVSQTFVINSSTAGPAANDSTEAATPTETPTETATQTENATQTQTDSASGDGPPPALEEFSIDHSSQSNSSTVGIIVFSNESLETIDVSISGPESDGPLLTKSDFDETITNKYRANYTGDADGTYTATLEQIADVDENENPSVAGETKEFTIDTTAPNVERFAATGDGGEIDVQIDTDEPIAELNVSLTTSGTREILSKDDFAETENDDGTYTYETSYDPDQGGDYLLRIERIADERGNSAEDVETANAGV